MSFFYVILGQENVFYNILERKNAFVAHKKRGSKSGKIEIFSKGVNPWFWSKNGHFSMCKTFSWPILQKKKAWKNGYFLTKTMG